LPESASYRASAKSASTNSDSVFRRLRSFKKNSYCTHVGSASNAGMCVTASTHWLKRWAPAWPASLLMRRRSGSAASGSVQ
jgi:hypothetical protein